MGALAPLLRHRSLTAPGTVPQYTVGMEQTLLLNATYEPLKVVHWQKAITLLCQGKVEIVSTYDKVVRLIERNLPPVTTRHVASIVYHYQPKVLAKEQDRLENPFGFVVTAYRSDPEINTAAQGARR